MIVSLLFLFGTAYFPESSLCSGEILDIRDISYAENLIGELIEFNLHLQSRSVVNKYYNLFKKANLTPEEKDFDQLILIFANTKKLLFEIRNSLEKKVYPNLKSSIKQLFIGEIELCMILMKYINEEQKFDLENNDEPFEEIKILYEVRIISRRKLFTCLSINQNFISADLKALRHILQKTEHINLLFINFINNSSLTIKYAVIASNAYVKAEKTRLEALKKAYIAWQANLSFKIKIDIALVGLNIATSGPVGIALSLANSSASYAFGEVAQMKDTINQLKAEIDKCASCKPAQTRDLQYSKNNNLLKNLLIKNNVILAANWLASEHNYFDYEKVDIKKIKLEYANQCALHQLINENTVTLEQLNDQLFQLEYKLAWELQLQLKEAKQKKSNLLNEIDVINSYTMLLNRQIDKSKSEVLGGELVSQQQILNEARFKLSQQEKLELALNKEIADVNNAIKLKKGEIESCINTLHNLRKQINNKPQESLLYIDKNGLFTPVSQNEELVAAITEYVFCAQLIHSQKTIFHKKTGMSIQHLNVMLKQLYPKLTGCISLNPIEEFGLLMAGVYKQSCLQYKKQFVINKNENMQSKIIELFHEVGIILAQNTFAEDDKRQAIEAAIRGFCCSVFKNINAEDFAFIDTES